MVKNGSVPGLFSASLVAWRPNTKLEEEGMLDFWSLGGHKHVSKWITPTLKVNNYLFSPHNKTIFYCCKSPWKLYNTAWLLLWNAFSLERLTHSTASTCLSKILVLTFDRRQTVETYKEHRENVEDDERTDAAGGATTFHRPVMAVLQPAHFLA